MKELAGFKIPLYNYGDSLITFGVKPYVLDIKSWEDEQNYINELEEEDTFEDDV